MNIPINDVLERLAYVLAKQTQWESIKAVNDCISAVENLQLQDTLELARQRLHANDPSSATGGSRR